MKKFWTDTELFSTDMKKFWTDTELFSNITLALKTGDTPVAFSGAANSAGASLISELLDDLDRPILVVVKNGEEAVRWVKDLKFFTSETGKEMLAEKSKTDEPGIRSEASGNIILFPEYREITGQSHEAIVTFNAHLSASLYSLASHDNPIAVVPASFLCVRISKPDQFSSTSIKISTGIDINVRKLMERMLETGFERASRVEKPGEFAYRGGILDIYIPAYSLPVRIEYFGDEVVSIREFDPLTQRSISRVKTVRLSTAVNHDDSDNNEPVLSNIESWFGSNIQTIWVEPDSILSEISKHDPALIGSNGREILPGNPPVFWDIIDDSNVSSDRLFSIPSTSIPEFKGDYMAMAHEFRKWTNKGYKINLVYHRESVRRVVTERLSAADLDLDESTIFNQHKPHSDSRSQVGPNFITGILSRGFLVEQSNIVFVTERDIVGQKQHQPWRKSDDLKDGLSFQDLRSGDLVVHADHGIGRYEGLQRLAVSGKDRDFLLLRYANNQKLYLPVDRLHLIQRYMSARDTHPALDKMGGVTFGKRKKKVKESVLKLAAELLKLFSKREVVSGFAYPPDDSWQREFELGFEYEETPDQLKAINQVKADMENSSPMDRIVCGDVGYGKTEVAMRAAFKAAVGGKQVAILVPTTILAQQHFRSFQKRFDRFPIKLAMLSRFLKARDKTNVLKELAAGNVDIIIGTHALLGDKVKFKNLGLVIIDEEQRFGVKHKEKLKQLRTKVDVLTLTATPIPRTLNMSLLGLREISLINTPPESRHPIKTKIINFNRKRIRTAILQEIDRGGQVYFVHNRVQSIHAILEMLRTLVPEASFAVGHGQMPESKLEKIMLQFLEKEFDVLVCTTIIESGLDIPSVNTIIINRADQLGLAQLYQLRGRVGRDRQQAYALLMVPASRIVTEKAKERLTAIREAVELGSGFKLATRDLDIRGAGDILGANQHGQISAVGFDMYCSLIREAVQELKGIEIEDTPECEIRLPYELAIPETYIEEPSSRLEVYRKFSTLKDIHQIDVLLLNLKDRFGDPPPEVTTLAEVAGIRIAAQQLTLVNLEYKNEALALRFHNNTLLKPEKIMGLLVKFPEKYQFNPPDTLFIQVSGVKTAELVRKARNELETLLQML